METPNAATVSTEVGWGYSWEDGAFQTWIAYPETLAAARDANGLIPIIIGAPTDAGEVIKAYYGFATLGNDGVLRPHIDGATAGDTFQLTMDGRAAVIGYDDNGVPIYSVPNRALEDPEEPAGLPEEPGAEYADMDEVEVQETPPAPQPGQVGTFGTGEKCKPKRVVTVSNIKNNFKPDFSDSVLNKGSRMIKYTVKADVSTRFVIGTSATVSGGLKLAILAEAKTEININAQYERTTTYGSAIEVEVPRRSVYDVDRGMKHERFAYKYTSIDKNCLRRTGSGKAWAPWKPAWVGDDRPI